MVGPIITVTVSADEVIAVLNSKRRRLRDAVDSKMQDIIDMTTDMLFQGKPGMYLDKSTITHGVTRSGNTTIGFVESTDKGGGYHIYPVNAKSLRFIAKSGDLVFTKHVFRPYLKGSKFIEEHLIELKPWIEDQLEDAVIDAL